MCPVPLQQELMPPLRGGYVTLKNANEYGEVGKEPLRSQVLATIKGAAPLRMAQRKAAPYNRR